MKLRNEPIAPVYLKLRSDRPGIGNPNRTGITLDSSNWSLGEEIKVIGLDDNLNGNQAYRIQFYDVSSADPNYDDLLPQDIHLVNLDDDHRPNPLSSNLYEFDNTTITKKVVAQLEKYLATRLISIFHFQLTSSRKQIHL